MDSGAPFFSSAKDKHWRDFLLLDPYLLIRWSPARYSASGSIEYRILLPNSALLIMLIPSSRYFRIGTPLSFPPRAASTSDRLADDGRKVSFRHSHATDSAAR